MASIADYSSRIKDLLHAKYQFHELAEGDPALEPQFQTNLSIEVEELAKKIHADINKSMKFADPKQSPIYRQHQNTQHVPDILGRALAEVKTQKLSDQKKLVQILNILDRTFTLPVTKSKGHTLTDVENFTQLSSLNINPALTQLVRGLIAKPLIETLEDSSFDYSEIKPEKLNNLASEYISYCGTTGYLIFENKLRTEIEALTNGDDDSTQKQIEILNTLIPIAQFFYAEGSIPKDKEREIQVLCFKVLNSIIPEFMEQVHYDNELDIETNAQLKLINNICKLLAEFTDIEIDFEEVKSLTKLVSYEQLRLSDRIISLKALSGIKIENNKSNFLHEYLTDIVFSVSANPLAKVYATRFLALNPIDNLTIISKLIEALNIPENSSHAKTILRAWSNEPQIKDFIKTKILDGLKEYFEKDPEQRNYIVLNDILNILVPLLENSSGFFSLLASDINISKIELLYIFAAIKRFNDFATQIKSQPKFGMPEKAHKLHQLYAGFEKDLDSDDDSILAKYFDQERQENNIHHQSFYQLRLLANHRINELKRYWVNDQKTPRHELLLHTMIDTQNIDPNLIDNFEDLHRLLGLTSRRVSSLTDDLNTYERDFYQSKQKSQQEEVNSKTWKKEFNRSFTTAFILSKITANLNKIKNPTEELLVVHNAAFNKALKEGGRTDRINDLLYSSISQCDAHEIKPLLLKIVNQDDTNNQATKKQIQIAKTFLEDLYYLPDIDYSTVA